MKKKLAAMTLAMAMAVTSLAGCGVQTTEEAGEAPAAETTSDTTTTEMTGTGDKEINILIYAQEHEKAVYEDLIAEFTKEHADEISKVNFEVTTQDEYGVKMTAAMTGLRTSTGWTCRSDSCR